MLNFGGTHQFFKHLEALGGYLNQEDIFLVGGAIRDTLLGKGEAIDIDITLACHPNKVRDNMTFDESKYSRFRTEKFGTITLIPKEEFLAESNINEETQYEITPFRTEGNYSDARHPDEIERSNDIIQDSKRRDFTINCMYRYGYTGKKVKGNKDETHDIEKLGHILTSDGIAYIKEEKTLIVQKEEIILELFSHGKFQENVLTNMFEKIPHMTSPKEEISSEKISIIIDPHQGMQDMLKGKIKTVGVPDSRFQEDALRIIRGVRFANILLDKAAITGIQIDFEKNTRRSMQENHHLLEKISFERVHEELKKVFSKKNPFGYISLLNELKITPYLFPGFAQTVHNEQPVRYHSFDTHTHSLLTLFELQKMLEDDEEITPQEGAIAKFAMLYHDVGKPEQYEKMSEAIKLNPENPDRSGYEYHTISGAKIAEKDFNRLHFPKKDIQDISRYIRWHHRPGEILDGKKEKRKNRLRKLLSEGGFKKAKILLYIAIADRKGQYNPLQEPAVGELYELQKTLEIIFHEEGRFTLNQLAINGNIIMEQLEMQPGPQIGEYLKKCFDRVLSDIQGRNNKETLLNYIQNLTNT